MATPEKKPRVSENGVAKPRTSNFNKKEVEKLEALISKHKDILFCKKVDHATTRQKDAVWNSIAEEFNANSDGTRTPRQLRNKFENLKKDLKREERRKSNQTGESADDDTDCMESTSNLDGNDGYDDDGFIPKHPEVSQFVRCEMSKVKTENVEADNMDDNSCSSNVSYQKSNEGFESNVPQSALEKTIVTTIKRMFKPKTKEPNPLQLKKIKALEDLHALELERMRESIRQQEELHKQLMKNNEEKHNVEMIKLNLEIEVLTLRKMELLKNAGVNF